MFVVQAIVNKMRKDRLYALGSLTLFLWISMTYFLFVHRPNAEVFRRRLGLEERSKLTVASLANRIDEFEVKLKRTSDENSALLQALRDFVKNKTLHSNSKQIKPIVKVPDAKNDIPMPEEILDHNKISKRDAVIAILMFACNRITVSKALDSLLAYRKDDVKFPIIVSQVKTCKTLVAKIP